MTTVPAANVAVLFPPANANGVPLPDAPLSRPATLRDIAESLSYIERLQYYEKAHSPNAVPSEDVASAVVYNHKLIQEYLYGDADVPAWFAAMRKRYDQLTVLLTDLETKVDKIKGDADMTSIRADIAGIRADVTEIQADVAQMRVAVTTKTSDISYSRAKR